MDMGILISVNYFGLAGGVLAVATTPIDTMYLNATSTGMSISITSSRRT
jgi:hypothetical protein